MIWGNVGRRVVQIKRDYVGMVAQLCVVFVLIG
jgi:hypothetical protein